MRKIFSLGFAILLLMNVIGYYGVFVGLEFRNNVTFVKKLDAENYAAHETITLSIPLTVPYAQDAEHFERVDGKFEYNGEVYRLVKQRLAKDTLTIVCVKDHTDKKIKEALTDYVKTFADSQSHPSPSGKIIISFAKEYIPQTIELNSLTFGWDQNVIQQGSLQNFISQFSSTIIQPPEAA